MVTVAVPPGTILTDAPYWADQQGDVWMGLPSGQFVMVDYRFGHVQWVSFESLATLRSLKQAGIELATPMTYTQAMVTILLRVISRFESSLRDANLI